MSLGEILSILLIMVLPWIVLIFYWKMQFKVIKKKYGRKDEDTVN